MASPTGRHRAPALLPRTLTNRLVVTLVGVVVVAAALLTVVTTLAMRSYLYDRLDGQVHDALERAVGQSLAPPGHFGGAGADPDGDGPGGLRKGASGTLSAYLPPPGSTRHERGNVVTDSFGIRPLSTAALDALHDVPTTGHVVGAGLAAVGDYRVAATVSPTGETVVAGLPVRDVDTILGKLVLWEVLLGLAAVGVAATAGRSLVRRQLRPLREVAATAHEVATLPLATGEATLETRVPDRLTDETTEVGQVGSAVNIMLSHVGGALAARERSEAQVRQFVADASHELRTPLSTIHGYAELSRRTGGRDPDLLLASMAKVEHEAGRMSALVDDLLLLARLDAGRPLERTPVDLTRLVLESVTDAGVVARDHLWRLDLPDEPVTVEGDELRLHQVVTNLLNNARRHTPPHTTVTAAVRPQPATGSVTLQVSDDGPGLSPDLAARAFERFTRGDSSRTRASGGAGLGLSLVEAIVAAHEGTVAVRSRPGDTVFSVTLPATAGEPSQPTNRVTTQVS